MLPPRNHRMLDAPPLTMSEAPMAEHSAVSVDLTTGAPDPASTDEAKQAQEQAQIDAVADEAKQTIPERRPEVPEDVKANVAQWFERTDNLVQRANGLFNYQEANKALFPSSFNANDPLRGNVPAEVVTGEDIRRVQIPRLFRDGLQTAAMSVPDDLAFKWAPAPLVEPPPDLAQMAQQMGMAPQVPGGASVTSGDPMVDQFARSMSVVERTLLDEARFIPKMQAWVQDSGYFPAAILKFTFRRSYNSSPVSGNIPDRDATDATARMQALITLYATKQISVDSAEMRELKNLMRSLAGKVRTRRYYGIEIGLLPFDSFGVSEDGVDLVDIYDAAFMFEDSVMSGEDILTRFPYKTGEDGLTYGVLPTELGNCVPYVPRTQSNIAGQAQRQTSGRVGSVPNVIPTAASQSGKPANSDPKKQKFLVRTVYSKQDRSIYTIIKGINHYINIEVPTKTCARWYPFAVLAPNRIPTEVYGASDLRLKLDIMRRINRKRSDEEKARWLAIERYIYNTAGDMDAKEVVKLGDIAPGEFKGMNFGSPAAKPSDSIFPMAHNFKPESYDTTKDERDLDMMGAIPAQALGATSGAGFATEANIAAQGSAIATQHRQSIIKREIDGFLTAIGEVIAQELTPEEARAIGGPYTFFPDIYSDAEVTQILAQAREVAGEQVADQVLQGAIEEAMTTGLPPDERAIQAKIDALVAPIVQAEMLAKYGMPEPVSREGLQRRMRIQIRSSFSAKLDKQQNLNMLSTLATSILTMAQAAQASGIMFSPLAILRENAGLIGDEGTINEAFPSIPGAQIQQLVMQAMAQQPAGAAKPGGGPPSQQGPRGEEAKATERPGVLGAEGGRASAEAGTASLV